MSAVRFHRNAAGLTLIELVVGLAVSSMVLLVIGTLYASASRLSRRDIGAASLVEASGALEIMAREVRLAPRHPDGIAVWVREEGGVRTDAVGVVSEVRWVYFFHDPARRELRRLDVTDGPLLLPPSSGEGGLLARDVQSFRVDRRGALVTMTITVAPRGRLVSLQTSVWPRHD